MKGVFKHFITFSILIVVSLFLCFQKTWAVNQNLNHKKLKEKIVEKKHKATEKSRHTIIKEAVMAVFETKKAIEYLEKGEKQKALDSLAMIDGKLYLILARQPELSLAPVDVRVETYDIYADIKAIKKAIKKSKILLAEGKVQQAREILHSLASEIDIIVISLPLTTYPKAIKNIARLIDKDKLKEAKYALYDLLNTLVMTKHVIPLPILRAEELLKQAEMLTEKKNRSPKENNKLNSLLSQAKKQLKMAQVLGYGEKKDYERFYAQIENIRKKTQHNRYGKGFFDEIKKSLTEFKNKIFNKETGE